jgi:hypothetical protein
MSTNVVSISYQTLVSSPSSLQTSIGESDPTLCVPRLCQFFLLQEEAFGSHPQALGIILVKDLPHAYPAYRERLLKLAYKFAHLDENVREKYADPGSIYR